MAYMIGKATFTKGQTKVTGTGTKWADNKQGIGYGCIMYPQAQPGNGIAAIGRVVSDTEIQLEVAYQGNTAANVDYCIINTMQDTIPDFARKLAAQMANAQRQFDGMNELFTSQGDVKLTDNNGKEITVPAYAKLTKDVNDTAMNAVMKQVYQMPTVGNEYPWYKMATVSTDQHGETINFKFFGAQGFNAAVNQTGECLLQFRYGNRSVDTNQPGAAALGLFVSGERPMVIDAAMVEGPRNSFDIYVRLPPFITSATFMTVSARSIGQLNKVNVLFQKTASTNVVGTQFVGKFVNPTFYAGQKAGSGEYNNPLSYNVVNDAVQVYGFGNTSIHYADMHAQNFRNSCVGRTNNTTANPPFGQLGTFLALPADGGPSANILAIGVQGEVRVGFQNAAKAITWRRVWTESSTTVDGNGFIKKASPVVKLFGDGSCELNEQSEGVTVERIGTGHYLVKGTLGFNSDPSWSGIDGGIEIPLDRNKQAMIWVDYEVNRQGNIEVKTYHREHKDSPAFARNVIEGVNDGDPIDIPAGRCVDLRVEMPEREGYKEVPLPEPEPDEDLSQYYEE
ncbi:hypothetical protein vBSlqSZDD2_67 [Serratia phage vB_SlqS_ZDD2]|nr:hypothetical protein vBSlqSZDD2_67 [Serratia phage vB_SlqS_ZDD2]